MESCFCVAVEKNCVAGEVTEMNMIREVRYTNRVVMRQQINKPGKERKERVRDKLLRIFPRILVVIIKSYSSFLLYLSNSG